MKQAFQRRETSNNSHSLSLNQQLMVLADNLREADGQSLTNVCP